MKVGIIGSGFGLYGLLPAFTATKGCSVVAICGKQTERLVKVCEEIGLTSRYTSWKEMLDLEELDAVAIAVKPSAQYAIAKYAIEKGIHVFAEKPLTTNLKEAQDLVVLAKKKRITTMVDFIFQEIDEWQKAKELLGAKTYGKLKHISVNWDFLSFDIKNNITSWKTHSKEGGGALSFYSSHVLYYIEYFAGVIKENKTIFTYSKESNNGGEVGVDSILTFKNNVTGSLHVSCNSKGMNTHRVTLICERGTLLLESTQGVTEYFTLKALTSDGEKVINVLKKNNKKNNDERVRIIQKLTTRFIQGCTTKSKVTPSFKDGLRVQELIEEIRKSKI